MLARGCLSGNLLHFTFHSIQNLGLNIIMKWIHQYHFATLFYEICLHKPVVETCPLIISCVGSGMKETTTLKCCNGFTFRFCFSRSGHVMHRNYIRCCRGTQRRSGLHRGAAHFKNVKEVATDRKNELNLSACDHWRCTDVPVIEKSTGNDAIIPFCLNALQTLQTLTSTHEAAQPLQEQEGPPAVWGFCCSSCCSLVWSE